MLSSCVHPEKDPTGDERIENCTVYLGILRIGKDGAAWSDFVMSFVYRNPVGEGVLTCMKLLRL